MIINGVTIDATFAEAFPMKATRAIITAQNERWAMIAAQAMTGFATSVIACGCEAGIERVLSPEETPDGRAGVSVMIFAMGGKGLAKQLETRAGQCVLTSPTSALFAGIQSDIKIPLGKNLRYFGDGFDESFAAARHNQNNLADHLSQFAYGVAVGGFDQLNGVGGHFLFQAAVAQSFGNRRVGKHRFLAAAQDDGVGGFKAERGGFGGDVGARFKDDGDDADLHAHFFDYQSVGALEGG